MVSATSLNTNAKQFCEMAGQLPQEPAQKTSLKSREVAEVGYLHNIWKYERVNAALCFLGIALAAVGVAITVSHGGAFLMLLGLGCSTTGIARADVEHITSKDLSGYPHGFSKLLDRILRFKPCPCVSMQMEEALKA